MKVRHGTKAYYDPVLLDRADPPYGVEAGILAEGDQVKVVKLPGCPPPGTMNMCHIEKDGKFAGLVCVNSLVRL